MKMLCFASAVMALVYSCKLECLPGLAMLHNALCSSVLRHWLFCQVSYAKFTQHASQLACNTASSASALFWLNSIIAVRMPVCGLHGQEVRQKECRFIHKPANTVLLCSTMLCVSMSEDQCAFVQDLTTPTWSRVCVLLKVKAFQVRIAGFGCLRLLRVYWPSAVSTVTIMSYCQVAADTLS